MILFDCIGLQIFQRIKRPYKGRRFENFQELDATVGEIVDYLNANHSLTGTANLPQVWSQIIDVNGEYYFD